MSLINKLIKEEGTERSEWGGWYGWQKFSLATKNGFLIFALWDSFRDEFLFVS
jgi:hypothetical protein